MDKVRLVLLCVYMFRVAAIHIRFKALLYLVERADIIPWQVIQCGLPFLLLVCVLFIIIQSLSGHVIGIIATEHIRRGIVELIHECLFLRRICFFMVLVEQVFVIRVVNLRFSREETVHQLLRVVRKDAGIGLVCGRCCCGLGSVRLLARCDSNTSLWGLFGRLCIGLRRCIHGLNRSFYGLYRRRFFLDRLIIDGLNRLIIHGLDRLHILNRRVICLTERLRFHGMDSRNRVVASILIDSFGVFLSILLIVEHAQRIPGFIEVIRCLVFVKCFPVCPGGWQDVMFAVDFGHTYFRKAVAGIHVTRRNHAGYCGLCRRDCSGRRVGDVTTAF